MKVVITADALNDLEEIGDHIGRDNPERARSFVAELIAKAQGLAEMPERFPLVPRYDGLGIRRRSHGAYLIFYRVEEARVTVIHILHGAGHYETLLFPED
jgi:plasmid stabilization system protein ParE